MLIWAGVLFIGVLSAPALADDADKKNPKAFKIRSFGIKNELS